VGVNGPYSVLLGAQEYTALAETRDHGYPVLEHVKRIVDGHLVWAPAIEGAFVLTTRGGDFELNIGQDVSIGYLTRPRRPNRSWITTLPASFEPFDHFPSGRDEVPIHQARACLLCSLCLGRG
jgi:uncharacterized linocin/CFP29 family protein